MPKTKSIGFMWPEHILAQHGISEFCISYFIQCAVVAGLLMAIYLVSLLMLVYVCAMNMKSLIFLLAMISPVSWDSRDNIFVLKQKAVTEGKKFSSLICQRLVLENVTPLADLHWQMPGARPPLLRVQILSFNIQNFQNVTALGVHAPPLRGPRPPTGNSGSATGLYCLFPKKVWSCLPNLKRMKMLCWELNICSHHLHFYISANSMEFTGKLALQTDANDFLIATCASKPLEISILAVELNSRLPPFKLCLFVYIGNVLRDRIDDVIDLALFLHLEDIVSLLYSHLTWKPAVLVGRNKF